MNKLKALLKVNIINELGINKFKNKSFNQKTKDILLMIVILLSLGSFIISNYFSSFMLGGYLKENQILDLILLSAFSTTFIAIFFLIMIRAQGVLFSEKEFEKLIFLPINISDILISKLFNLLIVGYLIGLVTYIPQIIAYGVVAEKEIIFYVYSGLLFIFLPIIPMVLASAVAFLLKYSFKNFKRKNLLTNFFTVGLTILIMIASFNSQGIINSFITNKEKFYNLIENKKNILTFIIYITKTDNPIFLLIYILTSILFISLFIKLFVNLFENINALLRESSSSSSKSKISIEKNTIIKSLVKKEISMYFSIPIYVTNTIIGPALILMGSIATIFIKKEVILKALELNASEELIPLIALAFLIGVISLSCTTTSSISLEGNNLWILKSLPIRAIDILKGKIILNLILILPVTIIASIIFKFTLGLNYLELLYIMLLSGMYGVLISTIGIIINVYFPRLNWTSPTQVVKQSFSVMLEMIVSVVLVAIPVLAMIKLNIMDLNKGGLLIGMYLLLTLIISGLILKYSTVKQYERIN